MNKFFLVLVIFIISGCSNKAIYNKLRLDELNKCYKEPPGRYSECIEQTKKTYEVYERERKDL